MSVASKVTRILDVGCGDGLLIKYLAQSFSVPHPGRKFEVFGMDVHDHGVQAPGYWAKTLSLLSGTFPPIDWRQRLQLVAIAEPWPYPDLYFDAVVSNRVLEHAGDHLHFFQGRRETAIAMATRLGFGKFAGPGHERSSYAAAQSEYLEHQVNYQTQHGIAGHELASHGNEHYRVGDQSPREFRADVSAAKSSIEDACGKPVRGYRAASFSINRTTWWAYEILAESRYGYSSSVYPIHHDHYGLAGGPVSPFCPLPDGFDEIPITTVRFGGLRVPAGGGGYFRLMPYSCFAWHHQRAIASPPHRQFLFPSLGNRSRSAARQRQRALTLQALCQPFPHENESRYARNRIFLGHHAAGLCRLLQPRRQPAEMDACGA